MYNSIKGYDMKTLKVAHDVWKRLKMLSLEKEMSISKVIEELLDGK